MDSQLSKPPAMPEEYKKQFHAYMQNYRDTHKSNIEASRKKWQTAHKDDDEFKQKRNALAKKYYTQNKNALLNPTRCSCGGIVSKQTNAQHNKTQKHIKYTESLITPTEEFIE
jgi:hypothetical protein